MSRHKVPSTVWAEWFWNWKIQSTNQCTKSWGCSVKSRSLLGITLFDSWTRFLRPQNDPYDSSWTQRASDRRRIDATDRFLTWVVAHIAVLTPWERELQHRPPSRYALCVKFQRNCVWTFTYFPNQTTLLCVLEFVPFVLYLGSFLSFVDRFGAVRNIFGYMFVCNIVIWAA